MPKPKRFSPLEIFLAILLVSAILGALIWVWFTYTSEEKIHARDKQRQTDVGAIQVAVEAYYQDNGKYPVGITGQDTAGNQITCEIIKCNIANISENLSSYLSPIPLDPINNDRFIYEYYVNNSRDAYVIYLTLEDSHDPAGPPTCKVGKNVSILGSTILPCTF